MAILTNNVRIANLQDWVHLAGPKDPRNQWVDDRSAKEVARAWLESAPSLPPESLEALATNESIGKVGERVAEPEARLVFDEFSGGATDYQSVGPGFKSLTLTDTRIEAAIIDPGKPWHNGTNESFNGKFRDECLSVEWFRTRREAQIIIEAWRQHYNAVRPHSSINYLTPHEFKQHHLSLHSHPNRAISQE